MACHGIFASISVSVFKFSGFIRPASWEQGLQWTVGDEACTHQLAEPSPPLSLWRLLRAQWGDLIPCSDLAPAAADRSLVLSGLAGALASGQWPAESAQTEVQSRQDILDLHLLDDTGPHPRNRNPVSGKCHHGGKR